MNKNYIIIGDSITYGAGSKDSSFGYAALFKAYITHKYSRTFKNYYVHICGFSGYNTDHLEPNFEALVKSYLKDNKENVIILFMGTNDSQYNDKGINRVSLTKYKKNITKFINISKKYKCRLVIIGLPGIGLTNISLDWKKDEHYSNKMLVKYDEVLKALSKDNKLKYIDLYGKLRLTEYYDVLHPNDEGHKKIFKILTKELKV